MFTLTEVASNFSELNAQSQQAARALCEKLALHAETQAYPAETLIYRASRDQGGIFLLRDGFLEFRSGDKTLFYYEPGDLVGAADFLHQREAALYAEFAVVVDHYPREAFMQAVAADAEAGRLYARCLELQLSLMAAFLNSLTPAQRKAAPQVRFFPPQSPMIIENTAPNEVYTLVNGTADVFVGKHKVGEVLSGEIFGAIAAATNTRRSASVIARTACLVLALPKEHFLTLAETHPATVMKLVEDMSRIIVTQNQKLVELQQS